MRRMARAAALACATALLAACGISADESPRDIPPAQQQDLGIGDSDAGETSGRARIYLIGPGDGGALVAVARDVTESPDPLLRELLAGANADEIGQQLRSAIPSGTTLISSRLQGTTLRIDLTAELLQLTGNDLVDALAQIVFTACEVPAVTQVVILVEGAVQQWPDADGVLQTQALTVYDYPGMVVSTQPDYPAFPSPGQD